MPETTFGMQLAFESVSKVYNLHGREIPVLRNLSLEIEAGSRVAIVGPSGSGKSTILALLGMLDRPSSGCILHNGADLRAEREDVIDEFRNRHIGFVFQFHHLLPEFTALENVMMPALIGSKNMTETQSTAGSLLEELELSDRMGHRPGKLSGGEQQRVALARALVNRPALLLADEPTGNLDLYSANNVIRLMWEMTVRNNMGMIIVTHEPSIASRADRILRLSKGKLATVDPGEIEHQMSVGDR